MLVHFFGDKRNGFVDSEEIYDFKLSTSALKSILLTKNKSRSYLTGLKEAEMILRIPKKLSIFED